MKAVVLEVKDGKAIVLTEDGLTKKIKYDGRIGEEIELKAEVVPMKKKRVASAIAAAVAVSVIAGGVYSQNVQQHADSYVAMNEEDLSSEGSEEAGNSGIDTGSCQESETDSKKATDQNVTKEQKNEKEEEKAAQDTKPADTQTGKKKNEPAEKTNNTSVKEDSAVLYQMQQQNAPGTNVTQQSSDPTVTVTGTGSGKKKQNDVTVSSQALASEGAGEEGQGTASVPAGQEMTPEEAMALAAEIAEKQVIEAAQAAAAEEAAKLAAEQAAASAAGTQVDSGAVNAPIVPVEPGVPQEE